jgi:hypothetical protein
MTHNSHPVALTTGMEINSHDLNHDIFFIEKEKGMQREGYRSSH